MPNFQNGKIYKIVSENMPGVIYYGSTTQTLKQRMSQHKELKYSSRVLIKAGNYHILEIEKYPCESKKQLIARERNYIKNNPCINYCIPGRTQKEWRIDNLKVIKQKAKIQYEKNATQICAKQRAYTKANAEEISKRKKIYSDKNRENINAKQRAYTKWNRSMDGLNRIDVF